MFKADFKYYKSKTPEPNFSNVIDMNKSNNLLNKSLLKRVDNINNSGPQYGLKKTSEWEAYELISHEGFIFIKNPFTSTGQRYWAKRCLEVYTKKPNKLNLDTFNTISHDKEWWDIAQTDTKHMMSLRWATLGYHHNWDTKQYSENNRCEFPSDLKRMTEFIAQMFGILNFSAEAAIVNYYHLHSTLSGHTDHSEQNLEAPLFSFSFGQTAIFMLGGRTLDEKPTPMFLHSGDVVIMNKYSRLCYHGIPKIISTNKDIWNKSDDCAVKNVDFSVVNDLFWKPFSNYLNHSRININVRQVLNVGQLKLNKDEKH